MIRINIQSRLTRLVRQRTNLVDDIDIQLYIDEKHRITGDIRRNAQKHVIMTHSNVILVIVLCACVGVLESAPMSRDEDKRGGVSGSMRGNGFHQSLHSGKRGGVARSLSGNGFHQSLYPMMAARGALPPTHKREPEVNEIEAGDLDPRDYLDIIGTPWGGGDSWTAYRDPWGYTDYGYYRDYYVGWHYDWPPRVRRNHVNTKTNTRNDMDISEHQDLGERDYLTTVIGMGRPQLGQYGSSGHNSYSNYGTPYDYYYHSSYDWQTPYYTDYYYNYYDYYEEQKKRHLDETRGNSGRKRTKRSTDDKNEVRSDGLNEVRSKGKNKARSHSKYEVRSHGKNDVSSGDNLNKRGHYWYNYYPYYYNYYAGSNDFQSYYNHRRDTRETDRSSKRTITEDLGERDYLTTILGMGRPQLGQYGSSGHNSYNNYGTPYDYYYYRYYDWQTPYYTDYYYSYYDYYEQQKKRHLDETRGNSETRGNRKRTKRSTDDKNEVRSDGLNEVRSDGKNEVSSGDNLNKRGHYWYDYPYYYYYYGDTNNIQAYYNHRRDTRDTDRPSKRTITEASPDNKRHATRDYFGSVIGGGLGGSNYGSIDHNSYNNYQYYYGNRYGDDNDLFDDDDYYYDYYEDKKRRQMSPQARRKAPTVAKKGIDITRHTKKGERKAPTMTRHQAKEAKRKAPTKATGESSLLTALKRYIEGQRTYDVTKE